MNEKKNLGKFLTQIERLFETAKQSIRSGSNETALNIIKAGQNEFEHVQEFFTTAILYRNFEIFKYILDSGKVNVKENPLVSSSLIKSNLREKTSDINKEVRENYIDIEMPYLIQAAVVGSVKIFEVLLSKGADISVSGYVSLTKKKMNCLITNVLGAATFFGNVDMVKYFIENKDKLKIDWDFKSSEKSSKAKSSIYSKELTNTTPLMLAIAGESSDENTLEIVKLMIKNVPNYKRDSYDFEGNSLLHLAVKNNKIQVVKYLVEECQYTLEECNNDGHSAFSLAQINNHKDIINYLNTFEKSNTNIDDLLELIQTPKGKNQKKGKKKKEREVIGLGSTEYQDTLKVNPLPEKKNNQVPPTTNVASDEVKAVEPLPTVNISEHKIISVDKKEYEAFKEKERLLKEKREKELLLLEQQQKAKEAEKSKKPKPEKREKKEPPQQAYQTQTESKNIPKEASVEKKIETKDQTPKSDITNTLLQIDKSKNTIVGMKIRNKELKEHKKSIDTNVLLKEDNVKKESVINEVTVNENVASQEKENEVKIEIPERELVEDIKNEVIIEENNEVREEVVKYQKVFEENPSTEKVNELSELKRRNEELELKYEDERRRRIELENAISSKIINSLQTVRRIETNEENIKDLLELANEELSKKANIISKLQSQLDYYELKNLSKLNNEDIQYLNNFYAKQIHNLAQSYEKKSY